MKEYQIIFIDAGNCDIFERYETALNFMDAMAKAFQQYTLMEFPLADIDAVSVRRVD